MTSVKARAVALRAVSRNLAKELTRWDAHAGAHLPAVRGALSMGIPLTVLATCGRFELAGFAAFGAFAAIYGRSLTPLNRALQQSLVGVVLTMSVAVGLTTAQLSESPWVLLEMALGVTATTAYLGERVGWRPAGPMFFMFAAGGSASMPAHGWAYLAQAVGVTAASATFAALVGGVSVIRPARRARRPAVTMGGRTATSWSNVADPVLAGGLAGVLAIAADADHVYWAPMTALAAFSVTGMTRRLARGLLRLAGTALGLGFAAAALALELRTWELTIVITVLQALVELFVKRNYAVALLFITPLALLVSTIGIGPFDHGTLMVDRLVTTSLGILAAVTVLTVRYVRSRTTHAPGANREQRLSPPSATAATSSPIPKKTSQGPQPRAHRKRPNGELDPKGSDC
jgi:hypothetical protein